LFTIRGFVGLLKKLDGFKGNQKKSIDKSF
jgi:hypothetical protein